MMRDLDASSPVVWPPWCYSVDIKRDIDSFGLPKSRRPVVGMQIDHPVNNNNNTTSSNNNNINNNHSNHNNNHNNNHSKVATVADVKTERLSPVAAAAAGGDSASSRSGTPSSSCYPGTPPGLAATADRVASPAPNRNCSDLIRSLAAKYQNANPSEYMPSRNGLNFGMLSAATAAAAVAAASKDHHGAGDGGAMLNPGFPFVAPTIPGTNVPMFPPMMDMSSTQALLQMVRTSQFDAFMSGRAGGGGGTKRPCSASSSTSSSNPQLHPHHQHGHGAAAASAAASEQNPLDLSSSSVPCKKPRKGGAAAGFWDAAAAAGSFAETFLNVPAAFGLHQALHKSRDKLALPNGGGARRLGSTSPKPPAGKALKQSACQGAPNRALPCASSCAAVAPPTTDKNATAACPNAADKSAVAAWTVDDVCDFVGTIDLCAEYSQCFRDQSVDGTALPLLTEEHLTGTMNMKLGPALKFRAVLARKLGNCAVCMHCAHCHGVQSHGAAGRHSPSPGSSSSVQS